MGFYGLVQDFFKGLVVNFDFGNALHAVFCAVLGSAQDPSKRGFDPTGTFKGKAFAKGAFFYGYLDGFGSEGLIDVYAFRISIQLSILTYLYYKTQ